MARFLRYACLFEDGKLFILLDSKHSDHVRRLQVLLKIPLELESLVWRHVGLSVSNGTPLYARYFCYPLASSLLLSSS